MNVLFVLVLLLVELSNAVVAAECRDPDGYQCTYNGRTYCGLAPCPIIICHRGEIPAVGDCCVDCLPPVGKRAEDSKSSKDCPYPCTQAGHHYCYPISCAMPYCVDGRTVPGECCPTCPNGPDCSAPDGHVILWKKWRIIGGKNCTCDMPPADATCV